MKLQNLSVIFIIIIIPILLITSYYISLQVQTLNMQTSYNIKLSEATKEAIAAFEINTVELNYKYSSVSDSKRRDTLASINTFTNSLANNLGIGGTSQEYLLGYIPAVVYTLYDGYYIYTPSETRKILTDRDGKAAYYDEEYKDKNEYDNGEIKQYFDTAKTIEKDNILYECSETNKDGTYYYYDLEGHEQQTFFTTNPSKATTEYKHILKPFTSYSETVKGNLGDFTINYTLDNYVRIYGKIINSENEEEFVSKSGYLINTEERKVIVPTTSTIIGIKLDGNSILPEILSEQVAYKENESSDYKLETYNYIYEAEGKTKVYIDGETLFQVDNNGVKTDIETLTTILYKKCTVPRKVGSKYTYIELYQALNKSEKGNWYRQNSDGIKEEMTNVSRHGIDGQYQNIKYDFSAINYVVESYAFSKWVSSTEILGDVQDNSTNKYIFSCDNSNNPEDENSIFAQHKREVIKETLNSDLSQAITSYARNSSGYTYQMPLLSETDWDQVLNNVSLITFFQGVPIGTKYYNNYAIATSTTNKEYVDPNEIYFTGSGDEYYHKEYCAEATGNDYTGYRSIDYIRKSYSNGDETRYYFLHDNKINDDSELECYKCLVDIAQYEKSDTSNITNQNYNTALARERYIARKISLPEEVEPKYKINILCQDVNEESISGAWYKVNENSYNSAQSIPISKNNDIPYTYNIEAMKNETGEEFITSSDYGTIDAPKNTSEDEDVKYPDYIPVNNNSGASIRIMRYDIDQMSFDVKNVNNSKWRTRLLEDPNSAGQYNTVDKENNEFNSADGDGVIDVILLYQKTYEVSEDADVKLYANINAKDNLTLATTLRGIKGFVKLKFTNGEYTYYSEDIYKLEDYSEKTIYCSVVNNIAWYNDEWKVEVVSLQNNIVKTNAYAYVSHYEIRNYNGLQGFAQAMNEGARSYFRENETKANTNAHARIFNLMNDISMGNINFVPIAGTKINSSWTWFDGFFEGNGHKISGIIIAPSTNEYAENIKYTSFGLFGNVGKLATIQNITISSIAVDLSTIKDTKDAEYMAGGLCGFLDEATTNNITISTPTIKGTDYVGGVAGKTMKALSDYNITGATLQSYGNATSKNSKVYVGGITGHSEKTIENCKIESSTIGNGNISVTSTIDSSIENWKIIYGTDKYYVGGIVGYTSSNIKNPIVSNNSTIRGGAIDNSHNDETREEYAGGIAGYYTKDMNESFQTNCSVYGHDNVGGIVGFSDGGTIVNLNHAGILSGSGENIGGIVGCKNGGSISNCQNKSEINCSGKNVGGIVGCNSNANITNCTNNAKVTGNANVGGIAGITYNGWIYFCNNKNTINGVENTNGNISENGKVFYAISADNVTGTGGITGKNYNAKISCSYNDSTVNCNFNGGGITGIDYGGTIEYCYNSINGTVTNSGHTTLAWNRLGGICGAGLGVKLYQNYNLGSIEGITSWASTPLASGVGGIIGFLVDNVNFIQTEVEQLKYIKVLYPNIGEIINTINNCYNVGTVKGHYEGAQRVEELKKQYEESFLSNIGGLMEKVFEEIGIKKYFDGLLIEDRLWYNGGIVGYVALGTSFSSTVSATGNYYLEETAESGGGRNGRNISGQFDVLNSNNLKAKLNEWTSTNPIKVPAGISGTGKYVYNTTSPFVTNLGYQGYGVLWWQLETTKVKLKICSKHDAPNTTLEAIPQVKVMVGGVAYDSFLYIDNMASDAYISGGYYYCDINIYKNATFDCKVTAEGYFDKIITVSNASERTEIVNLNKKDRYVVRVVPYDEEYTNRTLISSDIKVTGKFGEGVTEIPFIQNDTGYTYTVYEDVGNITASVTTTKIENEEGTEENYVMIGDVRYYYSDGQATNPGPDVNEEKYNNSNGEILIEVHLSEATSKITIKVNNENIDFNYFKITKVTITKTGKKEQPPLTNYNSDSFTVARGSDIEVNVESKYTTANENNYYYYSTDGEETGSTSSDRKESNITSDKSINFNFIKITYTRTFYPTNKGTEKWKNQGDSVVKINDNLNTDNHYSLDSGGNTNIIKIKQIEEWQNVGIYFNSNCKVSWGQIQDTTLEVPVSFDSKIIPDNFKITKQSMEYTTMCGMSSGVSSGKKITLAFNIIDIEEKKIENEVTCNKHSGEKIVKYSQNDKIAIVSTDKEKFSVEKIKKATSSIAGQFINTIDLKGSTKQIKSINIKMTGNASNDMYILIDKIGYIVSFTAN